MSTDLHDPWALLPEPERTALFERLVEMARIRREARDNGRWFRLGGPR